MCSPFGFYDGCIFFFFLIQNCKRRTLCPSPIFSPIMILFLGFLLTQRTCIPFSFLFRSVCRTDISFLYILNRYLHFFCRIEKQNYAIHLPVRILYILRFSSFHTFSCVGFQMATVRYPNSHL